MILKNAKILSPEGNFLESDLAFQESFQEIAPNISTEEGEEAKDCSNCYIVPGLIDLHTHGGAGADFSDGRLENMDILSKHYAKSGVTTWCPTTMTLPLDRLEKIVSTLSGLTPHVGAKTAGIYLEGPFFHSGKRGAQSGKYLQLPSYDFYHRLQELSGNRLKILAMAPELSGGLDFIKKVSKEVKISLAHTTADYETAKKAFQLGASQTTHLFNAMPPLTHRAPGVIGAAFDAEAYVELICDGFHVHPTVVVMAHKLYGKKMCFITDSLRCAGMPDGEYDLTGQTVIKKEGVARLPDGTLAGAAIGLLEGIRNLISFGLSPEDAFYGGSTAPAHALGLEDKIGSIAQGKQADFLILDQNFQLISTYVDGICVYEG